MGTVFVEMSSRTFTKFFLSETHLQCVEIRWEQFLWRCRLGLSPKFFLSETPLQCSVWQSDGNSFCGDVVSDIPQSFFWTRPCYSVLQLDWNSFCGDVVSDFHQCLFFERNPATVWCNQMVIFAEMSTWTALTRGKDAAFISKSGLYHTFENPKSVIFNFIFWKVVLFSFTYSKLGPSLTKWVAHKQEPQHLHYTHINTAEVRTQLMTSVCTETSHV